MIARLKEEEQEVEKVLSELYLFMKDSVSTADKAKALKLHNKITNKMYGLLSELRAVSNPGSLSSGSNYVPKKYNAPNEASLGLDIGSETVDYSRPTLLT